MFGLSVLSVSGVAIAMSKKAVCPFDNLPCEHVDCCDDILSLMVGFDCTEGYACPRAVVKKGDL